MNNTVSWFAVGAGVGCGIAMLMMTRAGRMFRTQIRRRAKRGAAYVKRSGVELRDQAVDLARKGSDAITNQKDALTAGLDAGRRAYTQAVRS